MRDFYIGDTVQFFWRGAAVSKRFVYDVDVFIYTSKDKKEWVMITENNKLYATRMVLTEKTIF